MEKIDTQTDADTDDADADIGDDGGEMADEMAQVKAQTTGDGMVEGTVSQFEIRDTGARVTKHQYRVVVEMPYGEPVHWNFTIPDAWTDEYAFVRWVEAHGYTAENFNRMTTDEARVPVSIDDGRELVIPDPPEPRVDWDGMREVAGFVLIGGAFLSTVVAATTLAIIHFDKWWLADGFIGLLMGIMASFVTTLLMIWVVDDVLGWKPDDD